MQQTALLLRAVRPCFTLERDWCMKIAAAGWRQIFFKKLVWAWVSNKLELSMKVAEYFLATKKRRGSPSLWRPA